MNLTPASTSILSHSAQIQRRQNGTCANLFSCRGFTVALRVKRGRLHCKTQYWPHYCLCTKSCGYVDFLLKFLLIFEAQRQSWYLEPALVLNTYVDLHRPTLHKCNITTCIISNSSIPLSLAAEFASPVLGNCMPFSPASLLPTHTTTQPTPQIWKKQTP